MDILKLVGFGLAVVIMIVLVSEQNKTHGTLIRLFGAVLLLIIIVPQLAIIFDILRDLSDKIQLEDTYLMIIFKIIGVAYISEFGYQLCKDAGEESIGSKVQFAGKVLILVIASPIALALIELVTQLL